MDELEATEFLVDKLRGTKNNADFFESMRREEVEVVNRSPARFPQTGLRPQQVPANCAKQSEKLIHHRHLVHGIQSWVLAFGVANPHIPVDNPPPSEAQIPLPPDKQSKNET